MVWFSLVASVSSSLQWLGNWEAGCTAALWACSCYHGHCSSTQEAEPPTDGKSNSLLSPGALLLWERWQWNALAPDRVPHHQPGFSLGSGTTQSTFHVAPSVMDQSSFLKGSTQNQTMQTMKSRQSVINSNLSWAEAGIKQENYFRLWKLPHPLGRDLKNLL